MLLTECAKLLDQMDKGCERIQTFPIQPFPQTVRLTPRRLQ
jgi:hypothetical protein